MKREEQNRFVTIPKAQRLTGLGLRQFRRAIANGELPVFDIGGWPRVRWRDVLAWVESKKRAPDDRDPDAHQARESAR